MTQDLATGWGVPLTSEQLEALAPRCKTQYMCQGAVLKRPRSKLEGSCCCCRNDHGMLGLAMHG